MSTAIKRNHTVMKFVNCGACGVKITSYDDGRGTPRKYCDRVCRNAAKKARHAERTGKQS